MVSPAGFEPATPGLEEPHSCVYSVAPMPRSPCLSTNSGVGVVYAVATKTPIPSLRGDAVVTDTRRETQGSPANPRPPPHGSPVPRPTFNGYVQNVVGFRRFLAQSSVLSTTGQGWNMRFVLTACYPAADWNPPTTSPTNHGHAQTLLR